MAAQLDDLTDAPVDYQDYASEAEELADLTADNRIAELATTDNKMLAEVFADIDTGEIPFMLSGYTEDDYGNIVTALSEALHTKEPSSDPDVEIPAPAAPVTQYGDLWILGRHRVLCGDCTRPEDRALLLDGNKPEILLTDPPYCSGGSKESQKSTGSIGTERKNGKAPKIANDILSTRGYQNLIRGALTDIPASTPTSSLTGVCGYICSTSSRRPASASSLRLYGTRARRAWASAGARSMSSFCSAPRLPPTSTATRATATS